MAQADPAILGSVAYNDVTLGQFIASPVSPISLKCSSQVRHRNVSIVQELLAQKGVGSHAFYFYFTGA
jgi:hypothetical protein